jgi:hypothetical protein
MCCGNIPSSWPPCAAPDPPLPAETPGLCSPENRENVEGATKDVALTEIGQRKYFTSDADRSLQVTCEMIHRRTASFEGTCNCNRKCLTNSLFVSSWGNRHLDALFVLLHLLVEVDSLNARVSISCGGRHYIQRILKGWTLKGRRYRWEPAARDGDWNLHT